MKQTHHSVVLERSLTSYKVKVKVGQSCLPFLENSRLKVNHITQCVK